MMIHKIKAELWLNGAIIAHMTECNKQIPTTIPRIGGDEDTVVYYDDRVNCPDCITMLMLFSRQPEKSEGVWVVYGYDTTPYPLFCHNDELEARRYQEKIGYFTHIKFWKFGDEWGAE